jgi:hypothetical protein
MSRSNLTVVMAEPTELPTPRDIKTAILEVLEEERTVILEVSQNKTKRNETKTKETKRNKNKRDGNGENEVRQGGRARDS